MLGKITHSISGGNLLRINYSLFKCLVHAYAKTNMSVHDKENL